MSVPGTTTEELRGAPLRSVKLNRAWPGQVSREPGAAAAVGRCHGGEEAVAEPGPAQPSPGQPRPRSGAAAGGAPLPAP